MKSLGAGQAHVGFNSMSLMPSRDPGTQQAAVSFFERMNKGNKKVCLGVSEGEMLGPALAENTGLTELDISWNHLRGPGAIAFARGLEV